MKIRPGLKRILKEERGFSLPELLVTMLMMLTVMFALYSIFDMSLRVFSYGNDKLEAVENARVGLEKMEREIRAAYPVDQDNGDDHLFFEADGSTSNPPDQMPSPTQITFGNDLNGDGEITCFDSSDCEYITYRLDYDNNTLLRNNMNDGSDTSTGGDPVAENVDGANGLEFEYLESVNPDDSAETESEISIVRIKLKVETQGQQDATQILTTDVHLRNRSSDE